MSSRKKWLICTECWWRFQVIDLFLDELEVVCPGCGYIGRVVGHWANDTGFCKDCYSHGCDASRCTCNCHQEVAGKSVR
jgi:hypothetical protein